MSIAKDLNEAINNINQANLYNEESFKALGRIGKMQVEASKRDLTEAMKQGKPNHFNDEQWKTWLDTSEKLMKI